MSIVKRGAQLALSLLLLLAPAVVAHAQPQPTANAPAAVSAESVTRASPYRINAGDTLEVYVWGEERLQRDVTVLPDGGFAFPLVGQLVAQGRLPEELERLISDRLRGQYRGQVPQVTVSVKAPSGLKFSVMGRVKAPGTFSPGRYVNVLEALSLAGGPAEFANLDRILIIRQAGDRLTTLRVQLASLFRVGADVRDVERANIIRIETGDTVIVP